MKILIVDDTKSTHAYVKYFLLRNPPIEIESFMNGDELLKYLKTGENADLILLDWEMPVMNGPDTLVGLKNVQSIIPIIMMTTKNAPEDIVRVLSLGASEYVMKPFTEDILIEKIQMVTGKDISYAA